MCAVFSLLTDAVHASFDHSYHLLTLKNKGGLVIPSGGAVKVASQRQSTSGRAVKVFLISQFVWAEIGSEDVFFLGGAQSGKKEFGIDNRHFVLMSLVVSVTN